MSHVYVVTAEQDRQTSRAENVHVVRVVSVHQTLADAKRAGLRWATMYGLPVDRVLPFLRVRGKSIWKAVLLLPRRRDGEAWVQVTRYEVFT